MPLGCATGIAAFGAISSAAFAVLTPASFFDWVQHPPETHIRNMCMHQQLLAIPALCRMIRV